jgi:hypothetical protein
LINKWRRDPSKQITQQFKSLSPKKGAGNTSAFKIDINEAGGNIDGGPSGDLKTPR